ncbi:uncharacterized protein LOC132902826 [Amyelois transitella]|uniref:uncharacterized protein LOC132902826 n=1 Tax=Amyelois transitella TaxID=680683 RepID=UPI0029901813|nr:uncharacterized protein LOC132902826 [Amyelois transitella]
MTGYGCLLAMCLIHVISIEGYAIKPLRLAIPPEGISFEINFKSDNYKSEVIQISSLIDMEAPVPAAPGRQSHPKTSAHHPKIESSIENRHGLRVGTCPTGYVKSGGFCFPDY